MKLTPNMIRMVRDPEFMDVVRGLVEAREQEAVARRKLTDLRIRDRARSTGPTLVKGNRDR